MGLVTRACDYPRGSDQWIVHPEYGAEDEEMAIAVVRTLDQLTLPRLDQGAVQIATTTNSTRKDSQARKAFTCSPWASAAAS